VRTADGVEHSLEVLAFATGFDALHGNYRSMDLRGRGGRHINEGWSDGPSSYLGLSTHCFPNLFVILGPNGPFTNPPPSIESQVDRISETIRHAERSGIATVEPSQEAEDGWTKTREEIANMTLFPKIESWIFGANIPGKKNTITDRWSQRHCRRAPSAASGQPGSRV
jgi:cyclohexanone monooxygenase